jgi:hypothetical protein
MKKTAITLIAMAIAFNSWSQNKETRDLPTFTRISFGVSGKAYVRQGNEQKVVLEGNPDLLQEIETEVRGDRLLIRSRNNSWFDWNWRNTDRVTVYITVKDITGLSVSGSGDMIAETIVNGGSLDFNVSGSGSLEAEIDATGDVEADVSGSGVIHFKGKCRSLDSDISGSGRVIFDGQVASRAKFDLTGSGRLEASGSAQSVLTLVSGSGRVMAANFETERCEVRITGSGDVQINVKSELDANITGSGSVSYRGNPNHINSHASGSGRVRKM